ncbi:MAG: hypothetical protein IT534_12090 [Bauldia sp.]|nr:hypothetical protein [Bauldia sp.]
MRLKLAAALAAFSAFTAPALAATDGCPDGTFDVLPGPGNTVSYLFGAPFVGAAGGVEPASVEISCSITPFAATDGFAVYSADYRGFTSIPESSQWVALTSTGPGGQEGQQVVDGPSSDDLDLSHLVGTLPGQALDITILLDLFAGSDGAAVDAGLDSADYALVAYTTWDSVKGSANRLAAQRNAIITHLGGTANLLLGALQPLDSGTGVTPIVAFGSSLVGVNGRAEIGQGFSVAGGLAFVSQSYAGASFRGALVGGSLRYVSPTEAPFRVFGEFGAWAAPGLGFTFTRTYENLGEEVIATGYAEGFVAGLYGRLGGIYSLNARNDVALAVTLAHTSVHVGGYAEALTPENPFPMAVMGGVSRSTSIKVAAEWTTELTDRLDATLMAGIGHGFGGTTLETNVLWVGDVEGVAPNGTFVEYGARLGWKLNPTTTIDAFVTGTAGRGIGNHTQIGGAVRLTF